MDLILFGFCFVWGSNVKAHNDLKHWFFFTLTSIHRESRVLAITFRHLFWKILPKTDFRQWICNIHVYTYISPFTLCYIFIYFLSFEWLAINMYLMLCISLVLQVGFVIREVGVVRIKDRKKLIIRHLVNLREPFLKIDVIFAFFIVLFLILVKCT